MAQRITDTSGKISQGVFSVLGENEEQVYILIDKQGSPPNPLVAGPNRESLPMNGNPKFTFRPSASSG